ncbi:MAG: hypothetical protein Fur002_06940 [Anaerolineales bacterium]
MSNAEQERLKRLREKQLQDRDPLANERKFQRNLSVKEKRMRKPLSLADDWRKMPLAIKAPIYALAAGLLISLALARFWDSPYALYVGIGITIALAVFSAMLGNALDLRDDIKKHLQ